MNSVPLANMPPLPVTAPGDGPLPIGSGAGPYRVWVEPAQSFDTRQFQAVRHNFDQHPLMQLPRLSELVLSLWSQGSCRFMSPGATDVSPFGAAVRMRSADGRRIDEVMRHLEVPGTWLAVYNVESDPVYKTFLEEVIAAARPLLGKEADDIYRICGYLFISSPPSLTPFHIDRENNFWLQVRGRKTMTLWDRDDRDVVSSQGVENFLIDASLKEVTLAESMRARGHAFDCGPGDGVYFPATSPHLTSSDTQWTRPGDSVAISMAVVFYSARTLRDARVHLCNRALRRLGLTPAFPGRHPWLDRVKAPIGALLARRRKEWPDVSGWSFDQPGK